MQSKTEPRCGPEYQRSGGWQIPGMRALVDEDWVQDDLKVHLEHEFGIERIRDLAPFDLPEVPGGGTFETIQLEPA